MERMAQFSLERLYMSPFTARWRYDEDGNVSWVLFERNLEPTGVWVPNFCCAKYSEFLINL